MHEYRTHTCAGLTSANVKTLLELLVQVTRKSSDEYKL